MTEDGYSRFRRFHEADPALKIDFALERITVKSADALTAAEASLDRRF